MQRLAASAFLLCLFGMVSITHAQGLRVTEIRYDAQGQPIAIETTAASVAPTVVSLTPQSVRRSQVNRLVAFGNALGGATVAGDAPGMAISAVSASNTQVSFDLNPAAAVALGDHQITFTTPLGSAAATVHVRVALPTLLLAGQPWVLGIGETRSFAVGLSEADDVAHALTPTIGNPALASASPTTLTIPIGDLNPNTPLSITGLAAGATRLDLTAPEFGTRSRTVFVAPPYQAVVSDQWFSAPVGVQFGNLAPASTAIASASAVVGVMFGTPVPDSHLMTVPSTPVGVQFGD